MTRLSRTLPEQVKDHAALFAPNSFPSEEESYRVRLTRYERWRDLLRAGKAYTLLRTDDDLALSTLDELKALAKFGCATADIKSLAEQAGVITGLADKAHEIAHEGKRHPAGSDLRKRAERRAAKKWLDAFRKAQRFFGIQPNGRPTERFTEMRTIDVYVFEREFNDSTEDVAQRAAYDAYHLHSAKRCEGESDNGAGVLSGAYERDSKKGGQRLRAANGRYKTVTLAEKRLEQRIRPILRKAGLLISNPVGRPRKVANRQGRL